MLRYSLESLSASSFSFLGIHLNMACGMCVAMRFWTMRAVFLYFPEFMEYKPVICLITRSESPMKVMGRWCSLFCMRVMTASWSPMYSAVLDEFSGWGSWVPDPVRTCVSVFFCGLQMMYPQPMV